MRTRSESVRGLEDLFQECAPTSWDCCASEFGLRATGLRLIKYPLRRPAYAKTMLNWAHARPSRSVAHRRGIERSDTAIGAAV